uniref:Uncharacterized protein n=1 Tax=Myotis myotis TaxID=51298 RepID=A0A7J7RSM0_MYOMY|nr:hypothetical protein mMyoMyo1_010186 [Myotis myotis]
MPRTEHPHSGRRSLAIRCRGVTAPRQVSKPLTPLRWASPVLPEARPRVPDVRAAHDALSLARGGASLRVSRPASRGRDERSWTGPCGQVLPLQVALRLRVPGPCLHEASRCPQHRLKRNSSTWSPSDPTSHTSLIWLLTCPSPAFTPTTAHAVLRMQTEQTTQEAPHGASSSTSQVPPLFTIGGGPHTHLSSTTHSTLTSNVNSTIRVGLKSGRVRSAAA